MHKISRGDDGMSIVLWAIIAFVGYIVGLVLLLTMTPRILVHSYDAPVFMAYATAEIFGALFAFGAVAIVTGLYNGGLGIKIVDFFLLLGIIVVSIGLLLRNFRMFRPGIVAGSRVAVILYCLLVSLAALYYIVVLFIS
jgi:hypothetical protein